MSATYTVITKLDVEEAKIHVKAWMNRSAGWVLVNAEDRSMTFSRNLKPNILALILLLLLWVLPGLLYLILGWKKETRNIYFKPTEGGKTKVVLEAGAKTKEWGKYMASYLSKFDETLDFEGRNGGNKAG